MHACTDLKVARYFLFVRVERVAAPVCMNECHHGEERHGHMEAATVVEFTEVV